MKDSKIEVRIRIQYACIKTDQVSVSNWPLSPPPPPLPHPTYRCIAIRCAPLAVPHLLHALRLAQLKLPQLLHSQSPTERSIPLGG